MGCPQKHTTACMCPSFQQLLLFSSLLHILDRYSRLDKGCQKPAEVACSIKGIPCQVADTASVMPMISRKWSDALPDICVWGRRRALNFIIVTGHT